MSDENEIDFEGEPECPCHGRDIRGCRENCDGQAALREAERGDETPPSPPIGSPEWWARMKACEDELKAMIREANDYRRKQKIRLW